MTEIIVGLIGLIVGATIVIKAEWFLANFGRIEWAEAHLGAEGGSRLMYKAIGILMIVVGIFLITGIMEGIGLWVVGLMLPK